tara:strand:+ start:458 stop:709 length:252 start_codon:yes stop_codon:yes gene_type:complete
MHKIDTRNLIFNDMRLPELIAQALSRKIDKPYEEILEAVQKLTEEKIESVEKNFGQIGQAKDISIDNPKDIDDFIGVNNVIKG